jgi:hypothetical protein
MFRPICAYCGKPEEHYAHCDFKLAVLACANPEHQAWAERDAKAWLGRNMCVKPEHYESEPLFQDTDILSVDVVVKRSSGEIEVDGWRILTPCLDESALIRYREDDGLWVIPVIKSEEGIQKHIPVRDLKMSLTEDKHGLVDAFEAKLVAGFYHASVQNYEEALKAQDEIEEPSAGSLVPQAEDYMVRAVHAEYGECRMFVPPSAPSCASDPVPPPPLQFPSQPSAI